MSALWVNQHLLSPEQFSFWEDDPIVRDRGRMTKLQGFSPPTAYEALFVSDTGSDIRGRDRAYGLLF